MTQLLATTPPDAATTTGLLSVIIPTLNEAAQLGKALQRLGAEDVEVIVADGGSTDATITIAEQHGATIVRCGPGRARQMNAGSTVATGDMLLFLHADTLLPAGFAHAARTTLDVPGTVAGAFRFQLEDRRLAFRLVEYMVHLRCRWLNLPYGDQALFMRRSVFEQLGGFPDQPIMEDVALVRALRRLGRVHVCASSAVTSARRWCKGGFVRVALFNQLAMLAYKFGISPRRIAKWRP